MSTSTGYVALLRTNRGFRLMWAGQFINLLGDSFNSIATIGLALATTGGSGLSVGLMLALRTVPRLLFSNVAGVWADRYDRRRLLIILDLLLAVATPGYLLVREPSESRSFRRDLVEDTRCLRGHPFLAGMIAVDAMWTLGGGGVFVILAMLNRARFGGGDETMGLLYAMAGLGGLLAAALRSLIGRRWKLDSSDLDAASIIRQMARVTGPGGTLLSVEPLGVGFDQEKWTRLLTKAGFEVDAVKRFFETETSRGETEHHALTVGARLVST
ncbi:MAG: MFS transporter [Anaerolineae bacterium]|nr:MFS transporter [Anaerolineae bacterium]